MNILITGATGYLGSQLAFAFSNHTVRVSLRDFSRSLVTSSAIFSK